MIWYLSSAKSKARFDVALWFSLVGGVLILIAGIASKIWHTTFFPEMRWMVSAPAFTTMLERTEIIGIVSGAIVIVGAIMMSQKPDQRRRWGAVVLGFSALSMFGMEGFLIGAGLAAVGGALAVAEDSHYFYK